MYYCLKKCKIFNFIEPTGKKSVQQHDFIRRVNKRIEFKGIKKYFFCCFWISIFPPINTKKFCFLLNLKQKAQKIVKLTFQSLHDSEGKKPNTLFEEEHKKNGNIAFSKSMHKRAHDRVVPKIGTKKALKNNATPFLKLKNCVKNLTLVCLLLKCHLLFFCFSLSLIFFSFSCLMSFLSIKYTSTSNVITVKTKKQKEIIGLNTFNKERKK